LLSPSSLTSSFMSPSRTTSTEFSWVQLKWGEVRWGNTRRDEVKWNRSIWQFFRKSWKFEKLKTWKWRENDVSIVRIVATKFDWMDNNQKKT
jgi:hypothetical protein